MARREPTPLRKSHGRALTNAEAGLLSRVLEVVEAARGHAARSVNSAMVHAYWLSVARSSRWSRVASDVPGTATRSSSDSQKGWSRGSAKGSENVRFAGSGSST